MVRKLFFVLVSVVWATLVFGQSETDTIKPNKYAPLADSLYKQGNYKAALDAFEKGLEVCIQNYGKMHTETAKYYNYIGMLCIDLRNFSKAVESFEESLAIKKQLFGETDVELSLFFRSTTT